MNEFDITTGFTRTDAIDDVSGITFDDVRRAKDVLMSGCATRIQKVRPDTMEIEIANIRHEPITWNGVREDTPMFNTVKVPLILNTMTGRREAMFNGVLYVSDVTAPMPTTNGLNFPRILPNDEELEQWLYGEDDE